MRNLFLIALIPLVFGSCKKDTKTEDPAPEPPPTFNCPSSSCVTPDSVFTPSGPGPYLIFKFKFDSTQQRFDSFGMPATVPSTNEACSPVFNKMSAHYIELAQNDNTPVGGGQVLYRANETDCEQGEKAITFCQSVVVKEGATFFAIPISSLTAGSYKWLRVSLAYQNYDIPFLTTSTGSVTQWGTIASFIGFNTYITSSYKIKNQTIVPTESLSTKPNSSNGGNFKQGYWGFETTISGFPWKTDGKAAGTTVVNPIQSTSPIPPGSCLVTGEFYNTAASTNSLLTITGAETSDIIITVSLSTNKSFEWIKVNANGYYDPQGGEFPVDMGIRGMIPKY